MGNLLRRGVKREILFENKKKEVITFHTSNNCLWEIFWEGVWKGKDFLRKNEKSFYFSLLKKLYMGHLKMVPPPPTTTTRTTLSSSWSVGFAADKKRKKVGNAVDKCWIIRPECSFISDVKRSKLSLMKSFSWYRQKKTVALNALVGGRRPWDKKIAHSLVTVLSANHKTLSGGKSREGRRPKKPDSRY